MNAFLRRYKKGTDAVGAFLFALLLGTFILQISARFIFGTPLSWTDEFVVVLYIWMILWAAALMLEERAHVLFDLVYNLVPPRFKRVMAITACVLIGVLFACAIPASWDYISFMKRESTAVLGIPFNWVFLPFMFVLIAIPIRYILRLRRLLGRNWKEEV